MGIEQIYYNLTGIHGARTIRESLALFDRGLDTGDILLCHNRYRIKMGNQTRAEFYGEALAIQSYVGGFAPIVEK